MNLRLHRFGPPLLLTMLAWPSTGAATPENKKQELPRFDAAPFSDEKTPLPSNQEWKPAEPVALTDGLPRDCNAYRLREWVKIHCAKLLTSEVALLGGSREGVYLFLGKPRFEGGPPEGAEMVFPVRRGDRRVMEWSTFGEGYNGPESIDVAFEISESWVADEASPVILARPR